MLTEAKWTCVAMKQRFNVGHISSSPSH